MAWTAPRTWGATEVVTADLLNEQIRDNLNETMCAKARNSGGFFTTLFADNPSTSDDPMNTGNENVCSVVERRCAAQRISTAEQTTSTTFADLVTGDGSAGTVGPVVTVETGQQALIFMSCTMFNTGTSQLSLMSWGISGATNRVTYFDPISLMQDGCKQEGAPWTFSQVDHMRGLVPGINTFTCKYRVGSGTGTFKDRMLAVFPL